MSVGAILTQGLGSFGSAGLLITLGYHSGEPASVGDAGEILDAARRNRFTHAAARLRLPQALARRRIQLARRPR